MFICATQWVEMEQLPMGQVHFDTTKTYVLGLITQENRLLQKNRNLFF